MTRELIQEMMSVLKHSDPADRTSVTAAAAQSDINEPLENLTQAIIALTAQIQSLENQFIMAQTARAQSFEDQVVTGLSARIMQALEDRITALVGASSDSQAPVEPLAQMVQCEGNDGALSNSQGMVTAKLTVVLAADFIQQTRMNVAHPRFLGKNPRLAPKVE